MELELKEIKNEYVNIIKDIRNKCENEIKLEK